MGLPPVVTGVSPKEGPPGTRVTIRGENLGFGPEDIIGLLINESNCLLSAEWVSSNKIIARSGPSKGRGDIIILTKSGGIGSCTVQFRGYHETIGPLKESAVWVDESHLSGLGRHRSLIATSFQQEDPLGLSVENAGKKFSEEELQDLFPDGSGDLGAENFSPSWFLLEHHHNTRFDDLKAGLSFLKRKVEGQKEGQISFLKAHAGSVIEQMDTLLTLKDMVEKNKKLYQPDLTANLEKSILSAKVEADRLFEDVLKRKDTADGTRNALGILQRFRFLFHLPAALDKNIRQADYDLVINDYARAKALFGNTEVAIFKRVLQEAEQRIQNLRQVLQQKLLTFPNSLDEQKKIIRNLMNLETGDNPAWNCLIGQYKHLSQVMFQCKDTYLNEEKEEHSDTLEVPTQKYMKNAENGVNNNNAIPGRIGFLEELSDIFVRLFPDLWKLGQAYFGGELFVRVDPSKREEFKKMVLDVVSIYSQLIRASFIPHTLDGQSPHRAKFGLWPPFSSSFTDDEGIGSWFVSCLRTVRTNYSGLLSLDLPTEPLNAIRDLLHDLRVHCMRSLLIQAAKNVTGLVQHETWKLEFIEGHGSVTPLPQQFETQMMESLQMVKETTFQAEQRETNLMDNAAVLGDLNFLVNKCLFNFASGIEHTASSDSNGTDDLVSCPEVKLLLALSNCQYTMLYILPRLQDHWKKLGYPDMSSALNAAKEALIKTDKALMKRYMEEKVEPLIGIVEPSMFAGRFDWNDNQLDVPTDVRPYCKEIVMNLISVHAEVALICPLLVDRVVEKVVRKVAAELRRLFYCVKAFSTNGTLQARADMAALSRACQTLTSRYGNHHDPFSEAGKMVPISKDLSSNLQEQKNFQRNLDAIVTTFERRMKLQLLCLDFGAD